MDLEGLVFWSFGALEVSKGAFGCCVCFFVFFLKFMSNARACDLHSLSVERLIEKNLEVFRLQNIYSERN